MRNALDELEDFVEGKLSPIAGLLEINLEEKCMVENCL